MAVTVEPRRRSVFPESGEQWEEFAQRVFPEQEVSSSVEQLQSWNLHISYRVPTGKLLPSDIVFVEPPLPE